MKFEIEEGVHSDEFLLPGGASYFGPKPNAERERGPSGRVSQCAQPISVPILGDNWLICRDQTRGPNWMAEDKSIGGGRSYSLPPSAKLDLNGIRPESLFVRGKHNSSFQEHKSYFSFSSLSLPPDFA